MRIRRTSLLLGAISVLVLAVIFWSDGFTAFHGRALSVQEALSEGVLQGVLVLKVLLLASALGIWYRWRWSRWLAVLWFPLLAAHNTIVEAWHTGSVAGESWAQAILISTLWVASLASVLFGSEARDYFYPGADG
jgi:hypothetical protein